MDTNQSSGKKGLWTIIILLVVFIAIFLGWKMLAGNNTEIPNESTATNQPSGDLLGASTEAENLPKTVTVTLTNAGYSPQSVTLNVGDSINFVNESDGKMWTASGPHPVHTDYPGFDEKSAADNGGSYSFTFTKVGTWKYHNHLNPAQFGTVTVQANGSNKD
ncbi:MAG: Plastocyanin [Candidatus Paceibacter sp.]|jgi:plastocyanin|nr:Plastocyanin [Candidatus Paceibacter sp.]